MFLDNNLAFSAAQAVTATAASTNSFDLGVARDVGIGNNAQIAVEVDTTFTAGGSATMQIQIQGAAAANFASPFTLIETDVIPVASLVATFSRFLKIPPGLNYRYIRLNYVVATGPMTAGNISAKVVLGEQNSPIYTAVQP